MCREGPAHEAASDVPSGSAPTSRYYFVEGTWEQQLGPLVPGLPSFKTVINGLRPQVAALVQER